MRPATCCMRTPARLRPAGSPHPANHAAHYRSTGPEIWQATGGALAAFAACAGTGRIIKGTGTYLKGQNLAIHVISAPVLSDGSPAILDTSAYDDVFTVTTQEAKAACLPAPRACWRVFHRAQRCAPQCAWPRTRHLQDKQWSPCCPIAVNGICQPGCLTLRLNLAASLILYLDGRTAPLQYENGLPLLRIQRILHGAHGILQILLFLHPVQRHVDIRV